YLNNYFELVTDLNVSTLSGPISSSANPFAGSFNGGGYTLSNLSINQAGNAGLFARLAAGGSITDLKLTNVTISSTGQNTGGIVDLNEGTIERVAVVGGTISSTNTYTGGIAGRSNSGSVISNSYAQVDLSGTTRVGGIGGASGCSSNSCVTINYSYFAGTVQA